MSVSSLYAYASLEGTGAGKVRDGDAFVRRARTGENEIDVGRLGATSDEWSRLHYPASAFRIDKSAPYAVEHSTLVPCIDSLSLSLLSLYPRAYTQSFRLVGLAVTESVIGAVPPRFPPSSVYHDRFCRALCPPSRENMSHHATTTYTRAI